jgi:hypothetical protein
MATEIFSMNEYIEPKEVPLGYQPLMRLVCIALDNKMCDQARLAYCQMVKHRLEDGCRSVLCGVVFEDLWQVLQSLNNFSREHIQELAEANKISFEEASLASSAGMQSLDEKFRRFLLQLATEAISELSHEVA